jgi:phosphatidylglycerophosphate synthase
MSSVDSLIPQSSATTMRSHLLVAATASRLLLVPILIAAAMEDQVGVTAIVLAVFMFADLADGVVARRLDVDDRLRRAADSVVDRVAINSCLLAASAKGVLPWPIAVAFIARDLWCAAACAQVVRRKGIVITSDLAYRTLTVSFAAWALAAPFLSQAGRTVLALLILSAALALAADMTRACRYVLARPGPARPGTINVGIARTELAAERRSRPVAREAGRTVV